VHARENAEKVRIDSEQKKKKEERGGKKIQTEPSTEQKEKKSRRTNKCDRHKIINLIPDKG